MQGAPAMQQCYERALKKNASLQFKSGLGVTLGITVKPTGQVEAVDVNPSVDKDMTQCFKTTVLALEVPQLHRHRRHHRAEADADAEDVGGASGLHRIRVRVVSLRSPLPSAGEG